MHYCRGGRSPTVNAVTERYSTIGSKCDLSHSGGVSPAAFYLSIQQLSPCFLFVFCFFVYSLLGCGLCRSWRGYVQSVSCPLSAQWRLVASTLFALRPGLSREYVARTKEITKENAKEIYAVPAVAMKSGVGRNSWVPPAPASSSRSLLLPPLPYLQPRHRAFLVWWEV